MRKTALTLAGPLCDQRSRIADKQAAKGALSLNFGLGWSKSHSFFTGQTPVLRYNRQLMHAISHDRIPIADVVCAGDHARGGAQRLCRYRQGSRSEVHTRPARHRSESGLTPSTTLTRDPLLPATSSAAWQKSLMESEADEGRRTLSGCFHLRFRYCSRKNDRKLGAPLYSLRRRNGR